MLEVGGLSVFYGQHHALEDVQLAVARGEIVVMLGANGAGKTTLLKSIAGLVAPRPGARVALEGRSLAGLPPHEIVEAGIALVRNHVERRTVRCPAGELRLELLPWREIPLRAVWRKHVQVIQFVAALIARHQDPVVVPEIANGVCRVLGGPGDGRPLATPGWHRVDVPDAGLVRRERKLRLVG